MSGRELEFAFKWHGSQYHIPVPRDLDVPGMEQFVRGLFARDRIDFRIAHTAGGGWTAKYPAHGLFDPSGSPNLSIRVDINPDRQGWSVSSPASNDSLPDFLGGLLTDRNFMGFGPRE